jgi:hypothetical protein
MAETVRDEITQLAGSIRALERQLEVALAKRRVELNYVVHDGIVRFEHVMIAKHRLLKHSSFRCCCSTCSSLCTRRCASRGMGSHACTGAPTWHSTASNSPTSTPLKSSIARTAPMRTVYSRTFGRLRPVPSNTGARSKHARRVLGVHARYGSFVDYGDADAYRHELERLRAEARFVART